MKTSLRIVSIVAVATAALGILGAPAGAGKFSGNPVTIEKEVVGPVPAGTVFTVEFTCTSLSDIGAMGLEPIEITFDEHGTATSQNEFVIPSGLTCTANETGTGGAKTVAYACEMTTTHPTLATCAGPTTPTVSFNDVVDAEGVITVTNTFVPAEVKPAEEVIVAPAFTG
ncbi:MAG: hypothetical protein ABW033_09855 [Acidimicrobiia bacterium]